MSSLVDVALNADERTLLDRFSVELQTRLRGAFHAVWLFGSRARGEQPTREDSDIDVLVLAEDATWEGKLAVHAALDAAARQLELEGLAWSFSVHVNTPAWLAERRAIRSFFIAEVDRDKVIIAGHG